MINYMPLKKFKNKILVCLVFFVVCKTGMAQETMTDFGVFTPAEQALKQCDFDEDAEAIVLLDRAQSSYSEDYNLVTQHRIRIKILKESGIDRGNIRIRYYSGENFELIRNIEGMVLSYDDAMKPVWN